MMAGLDQAQKVTVGCVDAVPVGFKAARFVSGRREVSLEQLNIA